MTDENSLFWSRGYRFPSRSRAMLWPIPFQNQKNRCRIAWHTAGNRYRFSGTGFWYGVWIVCHRPNANYTSEIGAKTGTSWFLICFDMHLLSFFLIWGDTRSLRMPALRPASVEFYLYPTVCKYSLSPLSQTQIDWVGRYRIRLTFKLSCVWH